VSNLWARGFGLEGFTIEVELQRCYLDSQAVTVKKAYMSVPAAGEPDPWRVLLLGPNTLTSAALYDLMAAGPVAFTGVTVDGERVSGQVTVRRVLHGQNAELRGTGPLNGV
ncbi:MAG: hypothetical protein ACM3XM_16100, partial [Mycobacterium leprae]